MKEITKPSNWKKRPLALMLSLTLGASSFAVLGVPRNVLAADDPSSAITTSDGSHVAGYEGSGLIVDPELVLQGSVLNGHITDGKLNGASVMIGNLKTGDTLSFTNNGQITGTYSPVTGILTLKGDATIAEYEAALQSVKFSTTSKDVSAREITFTLGSALPFAGTGNFYEYIKKGQTITWNAAKKDADAKSYFGRKGYLVTITSKEENDFVKDKTQGLGWIGAADVERLDFEDANANPAVITGDWRWVTGPEGLENDGKGRKFYKGYTGSFTPIPGVGPVDAMYNNWGTGEPNNYQKTEYVAHVFGPETAASHGKWNDYSPTNASVSAYVIEYGGMEGDETFSISALKTIEDPFSTALLIKQPAGSEPVQVTESKPVIAGKAEADSAVSVVIKDKDGNVVDGAGGPATVDVDGNWTFTPKEALTDGTYTFEVKAEKGSKEVTKTKAIDVQIPVPVASIVQPSGTVFIPRPEISGTATPNSKVTITYQDKAGNNVTKTIDVGNDGKWSHTPEADLAEGTTSISVTAAKDGKTSAPVTQTVTVDTAKPTVAIVQPSGNVFVPRPEISGTATPDSKVTITYQDKAGSNVTKTIDVGSDGKWEYTPETDLAEGNTTISVTAVKDGKTSVPVTKTVTVDTAKPTVAVIQPGGKVFVPRPIFEGTATPGSKVTITYQDKDGNNLNKTINVGNDGKWSFVPDADLAEGDTTISITAVKDGKTSEPLTKTVTVDTSKPAVTIDQPSGSVFQPRPTFEGTATPDSKVTITYQDKEGNNVTKTVDVGADGKWSHTPEADLADGNTSIGVTVEKDGKRSAPVTQTVTVDTTKPAVTATVTDSVYTSRPTIKGTATPGATITVKISENITLTTTADENGDWSVTPEEAIPDGAYNVEITAEKDQKQSTISKPMTVDTRDLSAETDLQLNSWNGTQIELRPLSGKVNEFTASVTNSVYAVNILPESIDPDAKIEVSVNNNGTWQDIPNGEASGNLPLNEGVNTIIVKVTDSRGNVTSYKLTVIRAYSSSGNSGPDGGSTPTPTTPVTPKPEESGIETSVNGQDNTFATGKTSTSGDRTTTSVQVDLDKLNDNLAQGSGQKLTIHSPKEGDVKVDGLTAETIKQLSDAGASLEISNPLAIYPVPGGKMDLSAVAEQLGNAALGDIAVHIDIARSSDALINNAKDKAAAGGYELLVTPVDLDLTFSHDGKTVSSEQLNGYAGKYIALPEGIDPNRITTGVIVNPDGSVFHVPTVVTKINSRYYAWINDLQSSGSYSVIWNPQDFDDVKNHWGKADVNNIAARLDLAGTGNNTFSPDRNVSRSEFSEIVVLGLGLMRQNAPLNIFPDVSDSAWYRNAVTIANEFDIVRGFDDGNFHGDLQITREQGIAMIARAYNLINPQAELGQDTIDSMLAMYGDAASVSAWAKADVARMIEAGIVQGNGPQMLNPQANMTRAEASALIARLLKTTELIDK